MSAMIPLTPNILKQFVSPWLLLKYSLCRTLWTKMMMKLFLSAKPSRRASSRTTTSWSTWARTCLTSSSPRWPGSPCPRSTPSPPPWTPPPPPGRWGQSAWSRPPRRFLTPSLPSRTSRRRSKISSSSSLSWHLWARFLQTDRAQAVTQDNIHTDLSLTFLILIDMRHNPTVTRIDKPKLIFISRRHRPTRTKRDSTQFFKSILEMMERGDSIPLSKSQVTSLARVARKLLSIYEVISRSFLLLQSVVKVFATLTSWAF